MNQPPELEIEFSTQLIDSEGRITPGPTLRTRQRNVPVNDKLIIEMVLVPGGAFLMGSPRGQGYPDEQPQHFVQTWPFWMSRYPVTQEQWQSVIGTLPCRFRDPSLPVDTISWVEASRFCEKLSARTRHVIHLPSEAQWEYACRAGTNTPFSCGPTLTSDLANYNGEFSYRGGPVGVLPAQINAGRDVPPNAFGLYDLHGNVWEWCADVWHDDYSGAPVDGSAWMSGAPDEFRVARGGSWHDIPEVCRSATRLKVRGSEGDELTGFRVVMD